MTLEEYNKEADLILEPVPKQYREGCKKYAYMEGHANGYNEVFIVLQDVVDNIFNV
jgi:hypothetical protein